MKRRSLAAIFALLTAVTLCAPAWAQQGMVLRFATLPEDRPSKLAVQLRPFFTELEGEIGRALDEKVTIKLEVFPSRELLLRAFKAGKVDLARMDPKNYIEVKKSVANIHLLGVETSGSELHSRGILFVREDSFIQTLHDLRGTDIAFGKEGSTMGHFLPQYFLMKHQLLASDLGHLRHFALNEQLVAQIDDGLMHVGVLSDRDFEGFKTRGVPLRKIAEFDGLKPVWVLGRDLPKPLASAIRGAFFKKRASKTLKEFGAKNLTSVTDHDFEEIRRAVWYNWVFNPQAKGH